MTTKAQIIQAIDKIEDERTLQKLLKIINLELALNQDTHVLSEEEKKAIDQGVKDIEEGRVFTSTVAKSMVDQWLAKR